MNLKRYNEFIKESNSETGEVILNVDGKETTWFYLRDAIQNGLLDETLDIMDDSISELKIDDLFDGEVSDMEDLTDLLESDFEDTLDKLILHLIEVDHLSEHQVVGNIDITGNEEDSEDEIEDYGWENIEGLGKIYKREEREKSKSLSDEEIGFLFSVLNHKQLSNLSKWIDQGKGEEFVRIRLRFFDVPEDKEDEVIEIMFSENYLSKNKFVTSFGGGKFESNMKHLKKFNENFQEPEFTYLGYLEPNNNIKAFNKEYSEYNGEGLLEFIHGMSESFLGHIGDYDFSVGYNESTGTHQIIVGYDIKDDNFVFKWVNNETDEETTECLREVKSYDKDSILDFIENILPDIGGASIYF